MTKQRVEADGAGMLFQSAAPLHPFAVKFGCPKTASATVSVVNGDVYMRTRLLSASGTHRLPLESTVMPTNDLSSSAVWVVSRTPHKVDADAGGLAGNCCALESWLHPPWSVPDVCPKTSCG